MSSTMSEPRVDQTSRIILATPKAIYLAMVDAEAIASWRPPHGMTMQFERFDGRVGGGYRVTLIYPEDQRGQGKTRDDADVADVRFVELDPFERIVEDVRFESDDPGFAGVMRITTLLTPVADGTKVTFRCENVPPGISPEDHQEGMASTLKKLANFIE
jgi:uncharacterized protein YndB with AHSA1/START domain